MSNRRQKDSGDPFGQGQDYSLEEVDSALFGSIQGLKDANRPARLPLGHIRTDGGTQPRAKLDPKIIQEYTDDMANGAQFPPVDVFYDGESYWLADGFHRLNAALEAELLDIEAVIHQGTRREAVLFSVGVNAEHGFRRSNEDKRRAVETLLDDPEWTKWSDREIARCCKVDHRFVGRLRVSLGIVASETPDLTQVPQETLDRLNLYLEDNLQVLPEVIRLYVKEDELPIMLALEQARPEPRQTAVRFIQREIAKQKEPSPDETGGERVYITKHGTQATMKTGGIQAANKARSQPRTRPAAPRYVADEYSQLPPDENLPAIQQDEQGEAEPYQEAAPPMQPPTDPREEELSICRMQSDLLRSVLDIPLLVPNGTVVGKQRLSDLGALLAMGLRHLGDYQELVDEEWHRCFDPGDQS